MVDVIYDTLEDIFNDLGILEDPGEVMNLLEDAGFMIVPIEDPTNLFGITEDSL